MEDSPGPARARSALLRWLPSPGPFSAFILLTLFFIIQGFPYEILAENLFARVQRASPMALEAGHLSVRLGWAGPGFEAHGVKVFPEHGRPIAIERLSVLPTWSWSWLRGDPSVDVQLEGESGQLDGRLRLGGEPGFVGSVDRVELALLPIETWLDGIRVAGRLEGEADLTLGDEGVQGALRHETRDGSISLPSFPVALPFQSLRMTLALGGDTLVRFEEGTLEGPVLDASLTGEIGAGTGNQGLADAPIDLQLQLRVRDPAARAALDGLGVRTARDGSATLHVGGTTSQPLIR